MHWRRHWSYFKYVLRHKWFVFLACLEYGLIWRGIVHDWSKFRPGEWIPYAITFYDYNGAKRYSPSPAFDVAWNHHQKINDHHWQYWLLTRDTGEVVPLRMPDACQKEMIADWRGAGRALGKPDTWAWYADNKEHIVLHPDTRAWVEWQLSRFKLWQQENDLRRQA